MTILTSNFFAHAFAIAVALLAIVTAYYKWSMGYWKRKGVLTPKTEFPYGNGKNVFFQKATFGVELQKVYDKFKTKGLKYLGYYFLVKPTLLIFDPELMKRVITKDFVHFTDHGAYVNEKNDPLTGHLFMLRGKKWKNLRIKLSPTFTSGKMKMMFHILVKCVNELVVVVEKTSEDRQPADIKDIVSRFTSDVIGSCAFGIECNSLKNPDSEFLYYGKKSLHSGPVQALKGFLAMNFPKVLDVFKVTLFPKDVVEFFTNTVEETVNYREKNQIFQKDFLQLLIQLKNKVKIKNDEVNTNVESSESTKNLTMGELTAQAYLFFVAGFETSSTTLTFCLFELASNISIQDRLRKEVQTVLGAHNGEITYDAIMEMYYMEKCINETLRKYPPLPTLIRECTQEYKIPNTNVIIEKGTLIFLPILGVQWDPEYYPDPHTFDPERFSPENASQRHPYTWLPFGEGPRMCLGLRFGMMQAKVALTSLLKDYRFSLNSKTKTPLVMDPASFTLSAKSGIWLNVEKL